MTQRLFFLTENHLKLIQHLYIEHNDSGYDGAPGADIKRPYGNSGACYYDVPRILGMKPMNSDNEFSEDDIKKAIEIHKQVATALQICCYTQKFEIGTYQRMEE